MAAQPLQPAQGRIYVSVMDAKGTPPPSRDMEAFHVWENGAARTVVAASPASDPLAIVVIVHGFERNETGDARKALTAFVETIRAAAPAARIALIGDVKTPVLTDITGDAAKLDETARRFAVSGSNMVFFEAIRDAAKALGKETTDRRVIVTFTKSTRHDADSQMTKPTVDALKKSRASVWSIDVTPEIPVSNLHATIEMDSFVGNAPAYSGGMIERVFGTTSLAASATKLANLIVSQYQVTFARPDAKGETELRVGVAGVPGEQVLAPAWYVR